MMFFYALSDFDHRKAYSPDGIPLVFLKNCASAIAHCLVKLFNYVYTISNFFAESLSTLNLFLRRVTALFLHITNL